MVYAGRFIKHKSFKDVCVEVTYVQDSGADLVVIGIFWNLAFVESFSIGEKVVLAISKEKDKMNEWQVLSPECYKDKCFRYSIWENIQA